MSAYILLDNAFKEYRNKISERYGEAVDNELSTNITVQDIFKNPVIKDLSDYISTLNKKYNLNSKNMNEKKKKKLLSNLNDDLFIKK